MSNASKTGLHIVLDKEMAPGQGWAMEIRQGYIVFYKVGIIWMMDLVERIDDPHTIYNFTRLDVTAVFNAPQVCSTKLSRKLQLFKNQMEL